MKKGFKVFAVAILMLTIFGGVVYALNSNVKQVTIIDGEATQTYFTSADTLQEFMDKQNIVLKNGDEISISPESDLLDTNMVEIRRAVYVIANIDGSPKYSITAAETVGDFLKELKSRNELSEYYTLKNAAEGDPIRAGMEIDVTPILENTYTISKEIPYVTILRETSDLAAGEERILQVGSPGAEEMLVRETVVGGEVITSNVVETRLVKDPVDNIVETGVAAVLATADDIDLSYSKAMHMRSTAYSRFEAGLSDYTASGTFATKGVVAVDPSVIPLGTKVYVEGYGIAMAEDTGGAIKGNKIDLCFDSVEECINWGVRSVTVYILE